MPFRQAEALDGPRPAPTQPLCSLPMGASHASTRSLASEWDARRAIRATLAGAPGTRPGERAGAALSQGRGALLLEGPRERAWLSEPGEDGERARRWDEMASPR